MNEEWCREKLEKLKIEANRLGTLGEIRLRLNEADSLESTLTNKLLSAPEIYECLDEASESEQNDMATDILTVCMSFLSINQSDLPGILERSLQHRNPKIRALALNFIFKEIRKNSVESSSCFNDDLVVLIVNCLQEPETSVGLPAVQILSLIVINRINCSVVRQALLHQLNQSDIVKCRVYEIAVNLAISSPDAQKKVEYLLDNALLMLESDDILFRVNVLEILAPLAGQNHGLLFFEQRRVFEKISQSVEELEQKPLNRLLIPGIMKFFGKIAYTQPQKIIAGYPQMMKCLFECLHSGDQSILPTSFDTLANLAHTQQGKLLLDTNYSDSLKEIFEDYASYLKNLPTELKNRAFNSLEIIFSAKSEISINTSNILEKWYLFLSGGQSLQFLMDFCKNPFPDIKVACLSFVRAICHYTWGVGALKTTAGFLEYLLDRRVEFDKEAKFAKFQLIELISESPIFDIQTRLQLRKYVNEGPYYVQGILEVAVEGS